MQAYSDPSRASNPYSLPDVEVFDGADYDGDDMPLEWGKFYYWSCFPGCLPDSEPIGPFETETEALADAQNQD